MFPKTEVSEVSANFWVIVKNRRTWWYRGDTPVTRSTDIITDRSWLDRKNWLPLRMTKSSSFKRWGLGQTGLVWILLELGQLGPWISKDFSRVQRVVDKNQIWSPPIYQFGHIQALTPTNMRSKWRCLWIKFRNNISYHPFTHPQSFFYVWHVYWLRRAMMTMKILNSLQFLSWRTAMEHVPFTDIFDDYMEVS